MEIKQAQKLVWDHITKLGYDKIETTPVHCFLHLIEEVGETARTLLYKETKRDSLPMTTKPSDIEDEVADILWQTLRLASYLKLDLETCFIKKYEKNMLKSKKLS